VLANGWRLTRYSSNVVNVFRDKPVTIDRLNDGNYGHVGVSADMKGLGNQTYSGHWYLSTESNRSPGRLIATDGSLKSIPMPDHSDVWSCGFGAEHVAVWNQRLTQLTVFSGITGQTEWTLPGVNALQAMWMSPDSSRLLLVRNDVEVSMFDTATGHLVSRLNSHNSSPIYVTFSADGKRVFTCGGDGRAVMWDLRTGLKLAQFIGNGGAGMTSADLSPDGRRVVTTTSTGTWQLWDASTGVQLLDVKASTQPLTSALFTSDGKRILTAGEDHKVREWDTIDTNPTVRVPIDPSWLANVYR